MAPELANRPVAHVNLDAIQRNLDLARRLAPRSKVMAVVKSNAYGHGVISVCNAILGVDAFAVARVNEGLELREAGIELPVYVLQGFLDTTELDACRISRLVPMLHSPFQVECLKASRHRDMAVWIKIDTGMHRLGFSPEDFRLGMTGGERLNVVGVMSHLANADQPDHPENAAQIEIFNDLTRDLDCELSIANSGGILNLPDSHFDWIRPGIMLYGGSPSGVTDPMLSPAMSLTAPILAINSVTKGDSIGYGSSWYAKRDTRVAVIGIGYADGYPRERANDTPVLVGGERRYIVGRTSMDMMFVEIEQDDAVSPGDSVTLWGDGLSIDDVGSAVGTIGYTLVSRLTPRVRRDFVRDAH
ncbi:MAG: alanine racemase [Pseudomonadales bacterium]|nr:alanine racemase [Pseudomonadales bacterium]